MLGQILLATFLGSVVSLGGGVLLLWREQLAKRFALTLVGFAAGSLMAASFFELIPDVLEIREVSYQSLAFALISGILIFFLFEKFLKWYHCHDQEKCDYHTFSGAVLFGDALHNFVDGISIALSFLLSPAAGVTTAIAVFAHEIPQEIGDFGVLLHAGYSRARVFWYNVLTALTALGGAVLGYLLPLSSLLIGILLAFIAGSFLYIAVSDLLPELRHRTSKVEGEHILSIILGVLMVWAVGIFLPE